MMIAMTTATTYAAGRREKLLFFFSSLGSILVFCCCWHKMANDVGSDGIKMNTFREYDASARTHTQARAHKHTHIHLPTYTHTHTQTYAYARRLMPASECSAVIHTGVPGLNENISFIQLLAVTSRVTSDRRAQPTREKNPLRCTALAAVAGLEWDSAKVVFKFGVR